MSSTLAISSRPSSERISSSAPRVAPIAAGTAAAVNMNERDWTRRKSTTSLGPAMKPPQDASDLEKVPIRRSTSSSTSSSSQTPAPRAPSTPTPCASSTISRAPCSRQSATMSWSGAMSPSIENTPSTTTSTPPPSPSARWSMLSSLSRRLWRNGRMRARDMVTASRIEAWSPESQITVSLGERSVPMQPVLAR